MKNFATLLILSIICNSLLGQPVQDRTKMEKERQAIQKELKEIQGVYQQVKGQKRETLGQLNLLQKKMALQDRYINNINREIRIINDDIYSYAVEINRLQRQLDTLKAQYARSVVYAYKNRSTYDYLNFIFSAHSFNDALKRIAYLKSYRSYRQQQVANIVETQKIIEQRKEELLGKKTQKSSALQNQTQQLAVLEEQKKEKAEVVNKLKSKESELSKQIAAKKKRDAQLKNSIAAIIRREIDARRKAEKAERDRLAALEKGNKTTTTTTATTTKKTTVKAAIPLNEKEVALSANFSSNRGRLPWPVDNGYVSVHFGTYSIEGTKIKGDNPGLTISTPSPGTTVKSVFDGEVIGVYSIGEGMVVTISHGKYFTTYSNLGGVSVSKGQQVHTGQAIGRAAADDEGGSGGKIDFLLMVEMQNVNPEPWLRPH
ncbi:MAG: peptidoglycan DD-metalloendopeptidase family protein [Chitinophagaceae bacterium]|nr:peptidoglycan DD-metalloendopeptidase family protein [Chitinophagaceae bacterium]